MEPLWEDVEEEAPDELVGGERHGAEPRLPVAAIVLVTEGHGALVEADEAAVREGDAVGVAGEIGEHRFGPGGGRWLDVEEPFLSPERGKMCGKGLPATQAFDLAEQCQPARRVGIGEPGQEEPPEQAGEHPHGQQEARSARHPARVVMRYPAGWDDDVEMRMMGHRRAPGVEHGGEADAGAEMLWISADREQRLGRGAEQQVVLARGEPILRRRTLALGTMPVAARVVGDPAVAAILTALDMTAEGSRAAALDGRHHLELAEAHMPGIGPAPGGAMVMEDVGNLQPR